MLKTALIAYGALLIPTSILALGLCRAAARGDRNTELALRRNAGDDSANATDAQEHRQGDLKAAA